MIASIPGRDARDGPMDLSYAAAERDAAPHLIPRGKVSNLTAKRLRAEIRARMKREASMSDERRLAAKLASTRVREPVNWPAEKDFTDVNRVPEPREHYFQHDAGGNWETRVVPRESVDPARPIRPGNATLAEVHRDRFQSRASDGDGGRGVAVMTESELAARSNLHSGAWQRRAGARLAGKFLPRRQFIGYGRGRGEIVPEEPPPSLDDDDPLALPGPRIYVEDEDGNYLEQDPNLMEPSARAAWNAKQRKKVSDEAAALAATRGLNGTVRVHSDSKTTPAENENHLLLRRRKLADGAKPLRPLLTPCWAEVEPERGSIPSGNSKTSDKKLSDKMSDNEPGVRISAPWATLGDVRAEPTNAGTSTRPGAGSGDAANASVSYVDPRDRVDRPAAIERKAKYTGRHSHHKDYREVRGVCEISRVVRDEPTISARRTQPPPPSPATLLHRSYLELDGGLEAYAPEMREGDEPPPSPPRPPRNAKSRARYHEHRGGGRSTVAEMAVPAGIDVGDVAAGAGRDGTAKSLRPTAPKKILRGRERADAMKRDYPYGPCTF